MKDTALANISIVLVRAKHPGNIGAAARAMHNMGLEDLRLAAPQCRIDEEAARMAKAGTPVLARARLFADALESIGDLHLVVGTTAKAAGYRSKSSAPRALAQKIVDHGRRQAVGILFGPEDTGLVDEDLRLCQMLMRIPTVPRARSLNLAQAVMVVCYELHIAGLAGEPAKAPRLAPATQVEAMYVQLEKALMEIGFLQAQNARHMMLTLRRFLGRAGLEPPDVGVLRGIARQIAWYAAARRVQDGICENPAPRRRGMRPGGPAS